MRTLCVSIITGALLAGSAVGVAGQTDSTPAAARGAVPSAGCGTSAIAEVAGPHDFGERCVLDRPVPFLGFHGTADTSLPYEGGLGAIVATFPTDTGVPLTEMPMAADPVWSGSIPERVAAIAARNGCSREPVTTAVAEHVDAMTWPCPAGAEVQLIVIEGGEHTWPGSPTMPGTTMEIDATRMIWDFFVAHPMLGW